jgi:Tfp pilus assembly protein PilV
MKTAAPSRKSPHGNSLVEAVIAVGVLAVAVPLVFGALAEAGKGGTSAQAETRATWIVRACMREIEASRDGRPQYFTATTTGQTFPPAGDVWALAFAPDGSTLGKVSKAQYDRGLKELDGRPVRYIAVMKTAAGNVVAGNTPMLDARISIEYPATASAERRDKLDFHTRIP